MFTKEQVRLIQEGLQALLGAPRADENEIQELIKALNKPEWWVLVVEHKYGIDVGEISLSKEKVWEALYGWVECWWDEELDREMPQDRDEAVAEYFNENGAGWKESYSLCKISI